MIKMRKIRILIAKPGLDGHDRGAKVLARSLMDEGFEVIYTGIHQTAEDIVRTAIEEDVDVLGLSILSGAHMYHFRRIVELMKEKGLDDVLLIGGGIIPEDDKKSLMEIGVNAIFNPGTSIKEISEFIYKNLRRKI